MIKSGRQRKKARQDAFNITNKKIQKWEAEKQGKLAAISVVRRFVSGKETISAAELINLLDNYERSL